MPGLHVLALVGLLGFAISASAAPTNDTSSSLTLEDILNQPLVPLPLADLSFTPVFAESNQTIVDTNPVVQAKIDNLPSVINSIVAAAATDPASPAPSQTTDAVASKVRRNVVNTQPPSPQYSHTQCAYGNAPATPQFLWNAAARQVCHKWWGVATDTASPYTLSPTVYIKEDSWQVIPNVGGAFGFEFAYMVRDNHWHFTEYYPTSMDDCTAELTARIAWMYANCLGDTSGFSSYDDSHSVIVYKAWRYPGPPIGFSSSPDIAAPISI